VEREREREVVGREELTNREFEIADMRDSRVSHSQSDSRKLGGYSGAING
jgi:hypothetical protein